MPLCNQTWVVHVDVFVCVGLLNECAQVGETHYGDRLVINTFPCVFFVFVISLLAVVRGPDNQ